MDLKKILPTDQGLNQYAVNYDWFHNTSIWYDEKTNSITLSGKQLREFCELYFKHRVENCALKHFPTTSDRNHYIGFGFALGLILALIIHLIIFYYGK